MNSIQNVTSQPQLIAVTCLEKSPLNVRKTLTKAGIDEMKASILSHGLMQNLVVYDAGGGVFHVVAGSRRLEAIRSLQAEGKLPEDFAVPCQIVTEDHAPELSLAENTVRLAMHAADQFEAFADLIDKNNCTTAEVAERFGIEESLVIRRMKLGRVAPELLAASREENLTLECLMAFTITDDHKRQIKVYKSLQGRQKSDARHIRACLTEKMIDAGSKLARFVGIDAYAAAGGTSRRDLFGDDVFLEKPALLHKLADKKLDAIRKQLEAEGWNWIEINPERNSELVYRCGRIQPRLIDAPAELVARHEQLRAEIDAQPPFDVSDDDDERAEIAEQESEAAARLEQLQEQLSAYVGFDARQMRLAGCCVSIGQDGTPFIDKGLVRPEHKKQLERLLRADAGDALPEKAKPKDGMPATLRRDLAAYRQQAAQAELAKHPAIAFDLLAFQVAQATLAVRTAQEGLDVQFRQQLPKPGVESRAVAAVCLEAIQAALPLAWLKPKGEAARFAAFRTLPEAAKLELLAYCVALTVKPSLPAPGEAVTALDAALSLTGADVADYWRPARASYLGRVTREQLLAISRDTIGESWSQSRSKDKKTSLVEQLDRAFGEPAKHGRTPEQAEKLKRWLPAGMAFTIAAEPKPAKAKKARKAA